MADKKKADEVNEAPQGVSFEDATDRGYFGVEVDDTPNEHYTVQGVVKDKPTPENQS